MIINFSIGNFLCIKDPVTLSFEPEKGEALSEFYIAKPEENLPVLKVALIYGANASGKTTILKALDFLRFMVLQPFEVKTRSFDFQPFLLDADSPHQDSTFSLEFIQNKTRYLYQLRFNKKAIVKETLYFYKPKKALVYERNTDVKNQVTQINWGSKIKIPKNSRLALSGNTLWNNTVLGGYLKTNFESAVFQEVIHWFKNRLSGIVFPNLDTLGRISKAIKNGTIDKTKVLELLEKADLGISDIHIEEETETFLVKTFFEHKYENIYSVFPLDDESAGTKRFYVLSGFLYKALTENYILLIDELDASLHPDLLKHFILTFLSNSKETQLIATTHHRELLLERDILRSDVIWFTEKKQDQSTDLFSLSDFDSSAIRKTSSWFNAYKIGKLGAVPNVKDFFLSDRE